MSSPSLRRFSHVIGIDDAPFPRAHRGDVLVVGVAFTAGRTPSVPNDAPGPPGVEGVLSSRVRRDGANATRAVQKMVRASQFYAHVHAVLFQGIALAGFNVIDIHALAEGLQRPVLVVARKAPDMAAIESALRTKVRGGAAKWQRILRAGPMEPCGPLFVQRAGLSLAEAADLIGRLAIHGHIPEPLRLAHLIAGGVTTGASRGRA
ncbi:MAG: DUF99 family protein [Polyangiaceae bacterium]